MPIAMRCFQTPRPVNPTRRSRCPLKRVILQNNPNDHEQLKSLLGSQNTKAIVVLPFPHPSGLYHRVKGRQLLNYPHAFMLRVH